MTIDEAKRYLESAGYNLELAIQNYYDSSNNQLSTSSSQTATQNFSQSTEHYNEEEEEVRPAIPREYDTLIQSETLRDIQLSTVRQQFSSSFRDLKREMEIQEQLARGQAPKRKCLEDIYRHPVDIAFNLDFYHAKLKGHQLGKWVAVLINNENFESLSFNRDIFNEESQKVKNILRKNFIFLRRNIDDIEAQKIVQIYGLHDCQTIPIFLIIDSVTGELKKDFKDCTKLSLKSILKELRKYSTSKDNQLMYNSSYEEESDSDLEDLKPSTSKKFNQNITIEKPADCSNANKNFPAKSIESDEESFASLNSNDISDLDENQQEPKVIDSDDEPLNNENNVPQTNVLLRLQDENHKFKYPSNRTVANLINYIYRNYLIQTGIYDNKTKRFSLISKIHNKCLTALDQDLTLDKADIHPSIVLLHNTLDKE